MTWEDVFGHEEAYPEQADGIEAAREVAERGGFAVVEGACGTGKTMLALTAGIDRVRDPDSEFERVLVLTSVKQQLRQFEDDLRTINADLPEDWEPVSGLTLVGKADVCPYARENRAGIDESSVYERCEGLRERTRNLVGEDGPTTARALATDARRAQTGLADSAGGGATHLETAGEPTPYRPDTAEYGSGRGSNEYCPFYAGFLEDLPEDGDPIEAVPFDPTDRGLLDVEDLVALAAGHGSCPHSVMGAVLPHVDVVIGNYYHAFDPTTAGTFTGPLLDEETFVVCDEAHMLEPRVRDLVSDAVADRSLRDAGSELTRVIQSLEFDDRSPGSGDGGETGTGAEARAGAGTETGTGAETETGAEPGTASAPEGDSDADLVRAELADSDVTLDELERTREFYRALREELDRRVTAHLGRTRPDWRADLRALDDAEIPLRDPEEPAPDEIGEWAESEGFHEGYWARAEAVGAVVARALNEVEGDDVKRAAPAVGRTLGEWYRRDEGSHFREIELERTWNESEPPDSWRRAYNARLALHNCVPSEAIGDRLEAFGGGILMSATLEPLEVFRRVTGLDYLESEGRPVVERTYGLSFPEENRTSFAVNAPKFTYDNRGPPGADTPARWIHADAAATVAAESPGNVLVGMPSYREAEWMADELRDRIDAPVLLDEASDDGATESLKADFFGGDDKVLVTSLRGTLTEGVDYRGDRLAAAVVCGVPIINTASPLTKAVRTAYDREFGSGFETALTVPAVRKARQAIGRVIRGPEEVGVRALVDARYARESWNGVREFLSEAEREEFRSVSPDMLSFGLEQFWESVPGGEETGTE